MAFRTAKTAKVLSHDNLSPYDSPSSAMLYHFLLLLMSYCAVFKGSQTHSFLWFLMFTGVYCLCMYIASLFVIGMEHRHEVVINMEGMVLLLWLSGIVSCEYTECPFTHRHLSVVCSVFTYKTYSWHTTEYLQCDRPCTLHNVCFRTVHLCLSVVSLGTRGTALYKMRQ